MTQRIIFDCDRCGAENIVRIIAQFPNGTQDDPNHGTETRYESVDLCPSCATYMIEFAIKFMGDTNAEDILAAIRTYPKSKKPV